MAQIQCGEEVLPPGFCKDVESEPNSADSGNKKENGRSPSEKPRLSLTINPGLLDNNAISGLTESNATSEKESTYQNLKDTRKSLASSASILQSSVSDQDNGAPNGRVSKLLRRAGTTLNLAASVMQKTELDTMLQEARSVKARMVDFAVRDDIAYADQGHWNWSHCFDPVGREGAGLFTAGAFSRATQCYHAVMISLGIAITISQPLLLSATQTDLSLKNSALTFVVLYTAGMFLQPLFALSIDTFEIFHPMMIMEHSIKQPYFWFDIVIVICGFSNFGVNPEENKILYDILHLLPTIAAWRLLKRPPCFDSRVLSGDFFDLMRLLVPILLFVHIVACLWLYIVMHVVGSLDHHLEQLSSDKWASPPSYYLFAYREVWMMTTGDSVPIFSDWETLLVIIMTPVGAMLMAVLLAKIITIYHRRTMLVESQQERLTYITQAMKSMSLPHSLQDRILEYQYFLMTTHDQHASKILFDSLSSPLKLEVQLTLFHQLFEDAPFFEGSPPNMIKQIIKNLENTFYQRGDFVIRRNEIGDEMFFILRGACDVLVDISESPNIVSQLSVGDYFGEVALVMQHTMRTAWIRCASPGAHLCMLRKGNFEEVMKLYPDQLDRLRQGVTKRMEEANNSRVSENTSSNDENSCVDDDAGQGSIVPMRPLEPAPSNTSSKRDFQLQKAATTGALEEPKGRKKSLLFGLSSMNLAELDLSAEDKTPIIRRPVPGKGRKNSIFTLSAIGNNGSSWNELPALPSLSEDQEEVAKRDSQVSDASTFDSSPSPMPSFNPPSPAAKPARRESRLIDAMPGFAGKSGRRESRLVDSVQGHLGGLAGGRLNLPGQLELNGCKSPSSKEADDVSPIHRPSPPPPVSAVPPDDPDLQALGEDLYQAIMDVLRKHRKNSKSVPSSPGGTTV